MIELVYARTADLIQSAGTPCFVGDPPENIPPPYAFVWGPVPTEYALTPAGVDEQVDLEFHVQVVAKEAASVLLLAGALKLLLRGAVLPVEGWRVFPLRVTGSTDVQTARGVVEPATGLYPAWSTLHLRLQATKENCP